MKYELWSTLLLSIALGPDFYGLWDIWGLTARGCNGNRPSGLELGGGGNCPRSDATFHYKCPFASTDAARNLIRLPYWGSFIISPKKREHASGSWFKESNHGIPVDRWEKKEGACK